MSERGEYNPDEGPQQRTEQIGNAFEQQEYERAVEDCAEAISKWSREGRQDAALELAQKIEIYRAQIAEAQPELLNAFDTKLAEAYLYAGDSENDNLTGAEERYQRVLETKLTDVPEEGELTAVERQKYSEVFHALDRLSDVAFVGGRYQEAGDRYSDAIERRAEFADDPSEQGSLACATYGKAASAFMSGDIENAERLTQEALDGLEGIEVNEELLHSNVLSLQEAIHGYSQLDAEQRERVLEKLDESVRQAGGSGGGVKRINFFELFVEAEKEAEENEG